MRLPPTRASADEAIVGKQPNRGAKPTAGNYRVVDLILTLLEKIERQVGATGLKVNQNAM